MGSGFRVTASFCRFSWQCVGGRLWREHVAIDSEDPLDMACARRRIGPEARVRTFRDSGHQRVVADADERAAEIADVGTREPQTGLLILNLLPSGAAVGDDDRRAAPWL